MSRDECGSGITMLSFLTGTVVGAAVTLLIAPKTGKEIRELLANYNEEFKKRTSDLSEDIQSHTGSAIEQGKDLIEKGKELINKGTQMVGEGKEFFDEKKKTLTAAIEAGKEAMEKEQEVLEEETQKETKKGSKKS